MEKLWLIFIAAIILCLSDLVLCCSKGTYFSLDLKDCLDCPLMPKLDCHGEHRRDINSCLENCVKTKVTPTPKVREHKTKKTTGPLGRTTKNPSSKEANDPLEQRKKETPNPHLKSSRKPSKFDKNVKSQRYIGVIKLDHFIVLVCVLIIGALVVAFIIWNFVRLGRRPGLEQLTCAGYTLMSPKLNELNTARTSQAINKSHDRRQQPGIQLSAFAHPVQDTV